MLCGGDVKRGLTVRLLGFEFRCSQPPILEPCSSCLTYLYKKNCSETQSEK